MYNVIAPYFFKRDRFRITSYSPRAQAQHEIIASSAWAACVVAVCTLTKEQIRDTATHGIVWPTKIELNIFLPRWSYCDYAHVSLSFQVLNGNLRVESS